MTMFECDACPRRFATELARNQHMYALDHWIWPYECETCDTRFTTQSLCDEHMRVERHWSYPYECPCGLAFRVEYALDDHQDQKRHYAHLYCKDCDRFFQNENNLRQHRNSRVHRGTEVSCPFCQAGFTTASGVSHHLESSACPKARNLDRAAIHRALRQRDPAGLITERLLEWSGETDRAAAAGAQWEPAAAWNGHGYQCYICRKLFGTANGLRQHVASPVHQAPLYHCPNKRGPCGGRKFPTLAALFNHLESESCGYARFETVQKNVKDFFGGGAQRAIALA